MDDDVDSSSLFALRAEILKRKESLTDGKIKLHRKGESNTKEKAKERIKETEKERERNDLVETKELERSRRRLEEKAAHYDRMLEEAETHTSVHEDYLVDFDRKGWDEANQEYVGLKANEKRLTGLAFLQKLFGDSEEMVEYIDEFGRTRLISKTAYEQQEKDREETRQIMARHFDPSWELRTWGTGFFEFSADESIRQAQLQALRELTKTTTDARQAVLLRKEERRLRRKKLQFDR